MQNFPPTSTGNKPKVHPVNPALLNTIRHRDPRLARQQQMQDASPSMRGSSSSSLRGADDTHKSDSKSSSLSSSYRNGSSGKSNRNDSGGNTDSESRRKGSSSRDKDKDRKRSESKSSTSSGSSCSSERQKGSTSGSVTVTTSSRSGKKTASNKCDKDAFEIAPLSTTFRRKSSTTSLSGNETTASRKKELKRKSHSTHMSPSSKNRSRSRSPIEKAVGAGTTGGAAGSGVISDRDDRQVFSTKKQSKSILADAEHVEELKNATALKVESKSKNRYHFHIISQLLRETCIINVRKIERKLGACGLYLDLHKYLKTITSSKILIV